MKSKLFLIFTKHSYRSASIRVLLDEGFLFTYPSKEVAVRTLIINSSDELAKVNLDPNEETAIIISPWFDNHTSSYR